LPKTGEPGGVRRTRRQRGSISADAIVKAAFEVSRESGLDKLSMPSLAEYLDAGVTSLYWYFRKKEDLLNAMSDFAVDTYVHLMPPLRPDETWQQAMREHYAAQRRIFQDDELLSDLILIRTSTYSRDATRRVFELAEQLLGLLVDQGFTPDNALRVSSTISVYTRGMIIHDRIMRLSNAPILDHRQRRMTDWTTMPILESLLDKYSLSGTRDDDFEFGVDRLISGFEQLLEEQDAKPTRRRGEKPEAKKAAATRRPDRTRKARAANG
jgi:AcrR family transcriptional regulator